MRIFITGLSGLLGCNLAVLWHESHQVGGCVYQHQVNLDGVDVWRGNLLETGMARRMIERFAPDVVVHTAGLTNVDACEANSSLATRLNVDLTADVARATVAQGARLVHLSSDHVFAGTHAWHREEEPPAPLNVYARTKAEAEQSVRSACPDALIVRTNFFGWGTPVRASFSDWILSALRAGREIGMFTDVFFTPILIHDLAGSLLALLELGATGVFHVAGRERLSKSEFARQASEVFGIIDPPIRETTLSAAGLGAPRPHDMSLSTAQASALLGRAMPSVREGLVRLRALEAAGWPARLAAALPRARV